MDEDKKDQNQVNVLLDPNQTKVLYTDNVFMTSSEDGVVFDFGQKLGNGKQVQIVARVGMSREHAKKFVDVLSKNLLVNNSKTQTGPKIVN